MTITLDLNGAAAGKTSTTAFTEQTPAVGFPNATFTADLNDFNTVDSISVLLGTPTGTESLSLDATGMKAASAAGITAGYNSATGVLTLSGADELNADWQTLLRHIVYN